MTAQEAIRRIRDHNEVHSVRERNFAVYITEALNMAIEALEKQIPKKPNLWCGKITTCPNCLRAISQTEALDVHCKYCGQFIDWGDTDG